MILVDTSVWADHLRKPDADLVELLDAGDVVTHPLVIEELACGHLPDRREFIDKMHKLPQLPLATHGEVLRLIADWKLYGTGIGSVDANLLASTMLTAAKLWSRDKSLTREAARLGVAV